MDDERRYLIGADLGTTAVKVGLFDTDGSAVAVDTVEHTLITPATGVVEQSPDVYWGAFKACLQRVLDTAGINRAAIIAMSLSVQGETLTFLDANGEPMGNFIVWLDTRAQAEAERLYAKVTRERSFYGFMASQRLGKPLSFNDESPLVKKVTEEEAVRRWPEFARIHELLAVGDTLNAQREWRRFILAIPRNEKLEAAMLALDKGWFDFSVNASIYAKAWSVLSLRFPTPMLSFYRQRSRETGVPLSYLYAISRQESALNPFARSPVGAAGLMQLMPQTAANIAGKCGIAYSGKDALFDPEINVSFGSCYLMQLLEKYGGNRILASAAYNAGPGRVTKWTDSDGAGVAADIWVESIPFKETRNYVQNVLVYDAIYQHFISRDRQPQFLSGSELRHRY